MDIMDSTDTPTGGLDQTTASSSSAALPLSVDQSDAFASPTNRSTYGGQEPTSSSSYTFSSNSAALDRMDAAARVDDMPTSTDDIMMPRVDFASHPSLTGSEAPAVSVHTAGKPVAEQAKEKAAGAMDAAKDKAADAKAAAADMTASAKAKAAAVQDKAEDAAESVKDKLVDGAEKAKVGAAHLFDQVKASLQSAEKTVEDKYEAVKDDLSERSASAHKATAPRVRSTVSVEATDTHPAASSMRDAHLHPGLSSLPSHGNEQQADKGNAFMSNSHHNALIAGDEAHARALADGAEPKDASASRGLLARMHDKLEDAAEAVKERVDGVMESHVRRDNDEHLSAAAAKDLPTLIDSSNTHNTSMVRAKMHPSAERTLSGADQDD